MPHLVRVWNYLPDISARDARLRSATGNSTARARTLSSPAGAPSRAPCPRRAASGSPRRRAAGHLFSCQLEPPHEHRKSAPDQRLPLSPAVQSAQPDVLARLCREFSDAHRTLFISGTASILGHATVIVGDAAAQTRETMSNIKALLAAANAAPKHVAPFALASICGTRHTCVMQPIWRASKPNCAQSRQRRAGLISARGSLPPGSAHRDRGDSELLR